MCLGTKLSDRSLRRYKAKGKKCGYIRVWKVVVNTGQKFKPDWYPRGSLYNAKGGLIRARTDAWDEQSLIHAFRDEVSAKQWGSGIVIVETMVHPDWVSAIGADSNYRPTMKTLTTKAIVMPKYPNRKVTVREFRAAIKGKKVRTYSWENRNEI